MSVKNSNLTHMELKIVNLKFIKELTYIEIAGMFNVSESVVKIHQTKLIKSK